MVSSPSSSVRKTYSTRRKSARRNATQDESPAEESDAASQQSSPKKKVSPSKGSKPKRVDVFLPPPSPKRSRFTAVGESDAESSPKSVRKALKKPSVSTNGGTSPKKVPTTPTHTPLTRASLSSFNKSKRAPTPSEVADDNESVVESTTGTSRRTRTEEQRIQYLLEQPDCGELEPHRAFCKRCDKWVSMGKRDRYPVYMWTRHVKNCKTRKPTASDGAESSDDQASAASTLERGSRQSEDRLQDFLDSNPRPLVVKEWRGKLQTSDTPERSPPRNEEERREFLSNDPRVMVVREWEVQCRACQKWIKLGNKRKYDLNPWKQHSGRCSGELPSGPAATMNRKMQLANDPQVKIFTAEAVVCNLCNLPVVLQPNGHYDLLNWHEHKLTCGPPSLPPGPVPPSTAIVDVPKPPASSADTEATLVGPSSSPSKGTKRQREDEENAEDSASATIGDLDSRPTTKRRTENYEPPNGFLPTLWRWATDEVRAFVNAALGSGEGAGESSSTESKA